MSKRYHPDTTDLPAAIATEKFQQLNEAYATLSNPERRLIYDQKIGFSRLPTIQPVQQFTGTASPVPIRVSSAYLDPSNGRFTGGRHKRQSAAEGSTIPVGDHRPLSHGELFALFLLGVTFLACLVLAVTIGLTQGETAFRSSVLPPSVRPVVLPEQLLERNQRPVNDAPRSDFTLNGVDAATPAPAESL